MAAAAAAAAACQVCGCVCVCVCVSASVIIAFFQLMGSGVDLIYQGALKKWIMMAMVMQCSAPAGRGG